MCSESHAAVNTLVTVVIASYNHARYIEASINSVINQTYKNIELLVIDDGSQDDSSIVLKRLQEQHGFDLRFQANQGLARTLNDAIARAKGSLIVPFGSDDIMLPHRIATQVEYMKDKPEVGICSANIETIDQDGNVMGAREQRNRNLPFRRLDFDDLFLDRKPGPMAATLMLRREALEKVGGFNADIRLEDVYIELTIAHAGYFIDVLGEVLAQYRDHPTNTFKNGRFMVDNVLRTLAVFSDHPQYEQVCMKFRNSMVLKYANRDKALSREILSEIPLRYWNKKTLRGMWRMAWS
ncbi:glycosyltransferase [Pseudomonas monteilii]|uniref:Glycosyl transferase n=1 Tax=Pseudomonas monteilii TaxID=76759 RepID=A0A2N1IQ81_9PSED|nr:glycosyltransferase [Pseudomonas monteilii]PKI20753.1 glycosyl transferase [Pseudomonas monteilii]RPD95639.1 glycosyltransferase [Pseudomonas monteilii]